MKRTTETEIVIDPDFESLFGEPDPDEVRKLRRNIKAIGVTDPLILWDREGELVLVDGHSRYRIAQELGQECPQEVFEFRDRDHVLDFMVQRQIGRRNLNAAQKAAVYMRSEEFKRIKASGPKRSGRRAAKESFATVAKHSKQPATHERVAAKIGTSPRTAHRIMTVLESDDEDVRQPMLKGELSPNQAHAKLKAKQNRVVRTKAREEVAEEDSPRQLAEMARESLQQYLQRLKAAAKELRGELFPIDPEWAHLTTDELTKCRGHLKQQLRFINESLGVAKPRLNASERSVAPA